jgi:UDP-2,3-diacylglucosamine pyrophosphatase LpxH
MSVPKEINRRKFVSSLGILGIAGACPAKSFSTDIFPVNDSRTILKAGPYLQSPCTDKVTIRWLTNVPCYSWIEYGENKDKLDKKAQRIDYGLVQAHNTVNVITIDNLQAGQQYFYRICSKKIEEFQPYKLVYGDSYTSDVFTFETVDHNAGEVSFLIFNDIHDRPESFPLLMKYQGANKKDFVFLNGDMFNFQIDEDQLVSHLLQPFAGLFATVPFFFSRGNHETRGVFARHLPEYFNSEEPQFYFSFQYGPMYAIVLDSGEDKPDDSAVYAGIVDFDNYRTQQAEWLKKEVQKKEFKNAKYKVVFSHIPLYYAGDWHGPMHCREVWGPILNQANIDILISGHTHVYGIHPAVKGQHNYPIVIGGGPKDNARTIIKVLANHQSFKLDMIDDNGKLVGSIKI